MAHHKKPKKGWFAAATPLSGRIEKALAENRTQQALELAKTLYRQEATPANKELLKKASLARARDLIANGHYRDAAVILANTAGLDNTPTFLADIAQEVAACGDMAKALELNAKIPDPALQAKVLAHIADEAVRLGGAGRQHLPPALHPQLDLILQAFAHVEKSEDEPAREKLQGIGLQSPFLEWKLFLRGLLAFYAQDDARAMENWQRLDSKRWPFRLAAPLRYTIDKAFAQSQPPAAQNILQQQSLRLLNAPSVQHLRTLQQAIMNERQLPQAFKNAEQIVPLLKNDAPQLVPRLASCFYWAIIHHGMPEDMQRYRRVFGRPADDPELARLEALALESRGDLHEAHKNWQRFEKTVAQSTAWPAEQKDRVRALVWARMGENADTAPELEEDLLPDYYEPRPKRPKSLKPGPEECFQQALKLAPDQLDSYQSLISVFLKRNDAASAETVARQLLQHFPENAPGLELLGDLLLRSEKYAEALEYYQRALNTNPLEQRTRRKVANAHSYLARTLAEAGRFDEARAAYQAAMAMDDRAEKYPILCKWAGCEFKAGQADRAQELLQQAYAEKDSRLAVLFSMLIETIRFKLSKLKTQFNKEFNALLAEPPTGAAAAALAMTSASLKEAGVKYHGQQTHEKKVRSYLEKSLHAQFTEDQLRQVCAALEALNISRLQFDYILLGQRQFPKDPFFFLAQADYDLGSNTRYGHGIWRVADTLKKARQLAEAMPRSPHQEEMLQHIQSCEQRMQIMSPMAGVFQDIFGNMPFNPFGPADGEDEFDDEEDYF